MNFLKSFQKWFRFPSRISPIGEEDSKDTLSDITTSRQRRFYGFIIDICALGAGKVGNIINTVSSGFTFSRRIGNTNYRVNVHFDPDATDTMEDKIMRMICNDVVTNGGNCGIMSVPQMSRQSERSA